jgi:hypothetical protein
MSSTGYIKDGKYHKADKVPLASMLVPQQTLYKQYDFSRQRFDHSAEILQPYDHKGKPNPKFIEASPDGAMDYGFIPDTRPPIELHMPDYYEGQDANNSQAT